MRLLNDINRSDSKSERTTLEAPLTHYDVLHVSREASIEDIKVAFRRLALVMHPDKSPQCSMDDFRRIQQAWECLRDSRLAYDQELWRTENFVKAKIDSAMPLKLSDMEEAIDAETDKIVYIFACRCGDEVEVWQEVLPTFDDSVFICECPGCSITYAIKR